MLSRDFEIKCMSKLFVEFWLKKGKFDFILLDDFQIECQ